MSTDIILPQLRMMLFFNSTNELHLGVVVEAVDFAIVQAALGFEFLY